MAKDFVCPECDHMFQVSTMRLLTAKRTKEGKILRCPRCKKEHEFRE
jgi:transcription elongation factor Elf1